MSRFRKSEYRAEKRAKNVEKMASWNVCQGDMGLCTQKKDLTPCDRCKKPYCQEHAKDHPKYCLGIQQ